MVNNFDTILKNARNYINVVKDSWGTKVATSSVEIQFRAKYNTILGDIDHSFKKAMTAIDKATGGVTFVNSNISTKNPIMLNISDIKQTKTSSLTPQKGRGKGSFFNNKNKIESILQMRDKEFTIIDEVAKKAGEIHAKNLEKVSIRNKTEPTNHEQLLTNRSVCANCQSDLDIRINLERVSSDSRRNLLYGNLALKSPQPTALNQLGSRKNSSLSPRTWRDYQKLVINNESDNNRSQSKQDNIKQSKKIIERISNSQNPAYITSSFWPQANLNTHRNTQMDISSLENYQYTKQQQQTNVKNYLKPIDNEKKLIKKGSQPVLDTSQSTQRLWNNHRKNNISMTKNSNWEEFVKKDENPTVQNKKITKEVSFACGQTQANPNDKVVSFKCGQTQASPNDKVEPDKQSQSCATNSNNMEAVVEKSIKDGVNDKCNDLNSQFDEHMKNLNKLSKDFFLGTKILVDSITTRRMSKSLTNFNTNLNNRNTPSFENHEVKSQTFKKTQKVKAETTTEFFKTDKGYLQTELDAEKKLSMAIENYFSEEIDFELEPDGGKARLNMIINEFKFKNATTPAPNKLVDHHNSNSISLLECNDPKSNE